MHTCTDPCIHSEEGVGPDEGLLRGSHGVIQVHTCLQKLCEGDGADVGSQDRHACMYTV